MTPEEADTFIASRISETVDVHIVLGSEIEIVEALLRAMHWDGWIFVVDASGEITLPEDPKMRLFSGTDLGAFKTWIRDAVVDAQAISANVISYTPTLAWATEFYNALPALIAQALDQRMIEVNTLVRYAEQMEENAIKNLAVTAHRACGVNQFEGMLPNIPAIIVGAGPSLNHAIPALKEAQHRAYIFAVSKAVKRLVAEGITPDVIVHTDTFPVSAEGFEGIDLPVPLLYDPDAYHAIPASWSGPLITYESHTGIDKWARTFVGELGEMSKGTSVAHTAYYFAYYMGCRPLVLVGVDCAFPGEKTHADGVPQTWGGSTGHQEYIEIPCASGGMVRSTPVYAAFATLFEHHIRKTGAKVIQTSAHGAHITGAFHTTLSDALKEFTHRAKGLICWPRNHFTVEALEIAKRDAYFELAKVIEECEDGLIALKRIRHLDPSNKLEERDYRVACTRFDNARNALGKYPLAKKLLERLMTGAALAIRKLQRQPRGAKVEEFQRMLAIGEVLFREYKEAAEWWRNQFDPVYEKLIGR